MALLTRQQAFKGIMVDGEWINNPNRVKKEFYHHFANRFADLDWSHVPMEGSFPRCLGANISRDLEGEVSVVEIEKAAWDCRSHKSPGPYGFSFEFFKKFLYLIGDHVTKVVKEFFISSTFPNGCNLSFIALIPKGV
nr:RNA-directed DNA polymerase, eukaryota [Tanacetum cinerariifolium]